MKEKIGIYCKISSFSERILDNHEKQEYLKSYFIANNSKKLNIVDTYVDLKDNLDEENYEYNRLIKDIFEEKINKVIVLGAKYELSVEYDIINKIENTVKVEYLSDTYPPINYLKKEQLEIMNKFYKKIMFPYSKNILGD